MLRTIVLFLMLFCTVRSGLWAQVPFKKTPDWESGDRSAVSTGCALADINNDGWLDLVVANGNDIARQNVVVYYNDGTGNLPAQPSWRSEDVDYHGHVAVGDVNNDGLPDVAVSVYLGANRFASPGYVKLYLNEGGALQPLPAWRSADSMYTFSCAFGDADADGDLDLAVACGEIYNERADQNRIYYNMGGGMFSAEPGWKQRAMSYGLDAAWADFDQDGLLDLCGVYYYNPNRIFRNEGDSIPDVTWWFGTDGAQYANSVFISDVARDGFPDVLVSNNGQLGGVGQVKMYRNIAGKVELNPSYKSMPIDEGSGIYLFDIDDDGDEDMLTGAWFAPFYIFLNDNGEFAEEADWTSETFSVVEAFAAGDVDNDGLRPQFWEFDLDAQGRNCFTFTKRPIHRIVSVTMNGEELARSAYCYSADQGWISIAASHTSGRIRVDAIVSDDLDFAVTNWDSNKGNYLFRNNVTVGVAAEHRPESALQIIPNPARNAALLRYTLAMPGKVSLHLRDMQGRLCYNTVFAEQTAGEHSVEIPLVQLAAGSYVLGFESPEGNMVRILKVGP